MDYFLIGVMFLEVLAIFYAAKRHEGGTRFLIQLMGGYTALQYLVRPVLFLYSRDHGVFSDLYDSRIGNDRSLFVHIYLIALIGTGCLAISFFPKSKILMLRNKNSNASRTLTTDYARLSVVGSVIGLLAILMELSFLRNVLSKSMLPIGLVTFSIFLWNRHKYTLPRERKLLIYVSGSLAVFALSSFSGDSKGILLFPIVLFISTLNIWKQRSVLGKKILIGLMVLFASIPIFSILQLRKLGSSFSTDLSQAQDTFPWFLSWLYPLAVRFDAFHALTDAFFAGTGYLGNLGVLLKYALVTLQWNPSSGRSDISYGQTWNQLVRQKSLTGSNLSSVSLAQGMPADGWLWAGYVGTVFFSIAIGLFLRLLGKMMDRNRLSVIFSFAIITSNTLFETGIVGIFALISGALKVTLFFWFLWVIKNLTKLRI